MSDKAKRRVWPLWLLALLGLAASALLFAPLADCPRCTVWGYFDRVEHWHHQKSSHPCAICGGDRRVSLAGRWWHDDPRRSPP